MEQKSPLFIVTGASGAGKTTVLTELQTLLPACNVFDVDSLHRIVGDDWIKIKKIWLRVARGSALGGRRTILCGTIMPWDIKDSEDFAFFSHIYYVSLHCSDECRQQRLRARKWSDDMILEHKNFADWIIANSATAFSPPMPIIDTSSTAPAEVALQIRDWVLEYS